MTAPARDPSKIRVSHDQLRTIRADVLDPRSLDGTVDGADAVISALGTRSKEPTTVYSSGVANIVEAMRRAGVRRFIGVSAVNRHLQRGRKISRADLAAAMLCLLEDPDTVRTTVDVAY